MKTIKCLGLCYLMACLLMACGSNSKGTQSVTGENGQVYESYQECLAAQDFQAAHQFLAKMKNAVLNMEEGDDRDKADQVFLIAHEDVFKQEALYLMSQDDEAAQKRIIYLLKEEGGNNDHVSMLIDLAIENDDEAFVKTLANQYTQGANGESLKKLMDYLFEKSQDDNKEFIGKLFKKIEAEDLLLELAIKDGDKKFIRDYASKHLFLSNTTLLNYLAGTKDKKDAEMILGQLAEEGSDIPSRPALGVVQVYDSYGGEKMNPDHVYYKRCINDFNNQCNSILSVAIKCKNMYLAQRTVAMAKNNISYRRLGCVNNSSNYNWKVTIDNEEANSIKKAYQDAVRSGAFK